MRIYLMRPQKKGWTSRIIIPILLAVLGAGAWWGCRKVAESPAAPDRLVIGLHSVSFSLLIPLAESRGFFRENGLEITVKHYESGIAAIDRLRQGELDIATAAEYAFVLASFSDDRLRAIATMSTSLTHEIIARRDRGIRRPTDLRGKRIGISPNTANEFWLYTFLAFHGIAPEDVTIVNMSPSRLAQAIAEGRVDVISSWDLYAYEAKKALGDGGLAWSAQNGQELNWLLITRQDLIATKPRVIERFLRALVEAERYLQTHEEEGKRVISRSWSRDPAYLEYVWPRVNTAVSLDQALVVDMESTARWIAKNKIPGRSVSSNWLDLLYLKGLEAVNPPAVTIFR